MTRTNGKLLSVIGMWVALVTSDSQLWGQGGTPASGLPATNLVIREFRFTGNSAIPTAELSQVVSGYTNRAVSFGELEEARRAVTLHYVSQGYLNSGAVLDDQTVKDGIVTLRLVEGRLTEIRVHPADNRLRAGYVRSRLWRAAGPPVNMPRIEQRLGLLLDNPNIVRINAELEPGAAPGEAVLNVAVTERSPWRLAVEARNDRPPSVGGEILAAFASHQNVTGHGDALEFHTGLIQRDANRVRASAADNLGVSYRFPLNSYDTTLRLSYGRNNFAVIEEPFNALDIKSESESYGLALQHPFYRTANREFSMTLAADRRSSRSFLLGAPFSFSPGAVNGETTVSVLRFIHGFVGRSPMQVLSLRSSLNWGIDVLGATRNGTSRDGGFVSWQGQAQYVRRLGQTANQLVLSTTFQWSDSPLLSLEQFSLGGSGTVRGYRENQLVRDMAWLSSAEFRIPILFNRAGAGILQLAPFFDYGKGWNVRVATPQPPDLASVGIGLLWTPNARLNAQLYWGHAFRNLNAGGSDAQDLGLHFKVRVIAF